MSAVLAPPRATGSPSAAPATAPAPPAAPPGVRVPGRPAAARATAPAAVRDVPRDAARPSPLGWARLAVGGPVAALGAMLAVHLTGPGNPVSDVLSSYALTPGTAGLFAVAVLAMAAGTLGLAVALRRLHPAAVRGAVPALLAAAAGALAVTVVFPTDPSNAPMSLSGQLHRWSATVAMLAVPAAGLLAWRRLRRGADRRLARAAGTTTAAALLCLVVYLLSCIPSVLPGTPFAAAFDAVLPHFDARGLTERVVMLAEIGLLLGTGLAVLTRLRRP